MRLIEISDASELEKKATISTQMARIIKVPQVFEPPIGKLTSPTTKSPFHLTLYHSAADGGAG